MYAQVELAVDPKVRALCARPYPNHPRGCPQPGNCPTCPPRGRLITDVLDLSQPTFVICTEFPLGEHVAKLKAKHPDWTQRQLACCLYWQPKARQNLLQAIKDFAKLHPSLFITASPEAMGVNVTETMRRAGVQLEWPPVARTYQVAVAGTRLATREYK